MMIAHKSLSSLIVVLVTILGAGVVTKIEATAEQTLLAHAQGVDPEHQNVEILKDQIRFLWVGGGAILGSCVGLWIRAVAGLLAMSRTFGVSLFTSLACTPYVLRRWSNGFPEECFILAFLAAVGAWLAWEVALIIAIRVKEAAKKRGWIGVKEEVFGAGQAATVTTGQTTSPIPQEPDRRPA